jgi:hypothetical protein
MRISYISIHILMRYPVNISCMISCLESWDILKITLYPTYPIKISCMLSCNEILKDIFAGYPTWSIGRSWGPAKGAARSPRRMDSQPAWSGGGGTASVTSGFCRFTSDLLQLRRPARVFCGELVGARKDARHSNFRYRSFPVRSQSLPSLGAFRGLVLVWQARQSGTFSGAFRQCHF